MITLQNIITPDRTLCAVSCTSKKRILDTICETAAQTLTEHDHHDLLTSLMEREKMGSTGIGNGLAIPHGRLPDIKEVIAIVVTSQTPIDFDAIDNRPVDIFVGLFVPADSGQEHLSTLQSIAKTFSDKEISKAVRKCQTNQDLFDVIQSQSN